MRRSILWLTLPGAAVALSLLAAAAPPKLSRALEAQQALVEQRPNDVGALNDLGNLLRYAGRRDEAESTYRRALELDANRASTHFNLGLLLQEMGKQADALDAFRKTVKLDPEHAWAYYQMGAILESRSHTERAIEAYARAFSLNPELAFPEVNPHVIENRLLTTALMRSKAGAQKPIAVPETYDDAHRIADLLVPPPEPSAPTEAPPNERAPGSEKPMAAAAAAAAKRPTPAAAAPAAKVLSEDNLYRGPVVGQASNAGASQGGRGGRPTARPGTQPGRTWNWQAPASGQPVGGQPNTYTTRTPTYQPPARPGQQTKPQIQQAGTPFQTPGGPTTVTPSPDLNSTGFRAPGFGNPNPGVRSTGRLRNELLPPPSPPTATAAG